MYLRKATRSGIIQDCTPYGALRSLSTAVRRTSTPAQLSHGTDARLISHIPGSGIEHSHAPRHVAWGGGSVVNVLDFLR